MFFEKVIGGIPIVCSNVISARHGFTTRAGGVSQGIFESLNLGENRGDDIERVRENYRLAAGVFGVGEDDFVVSCQVHGKTVRVAAEEDRHTVGLPTGYEADGLVTNIPGLPIMIFVADCVPVLLHDPENRVIGAVHCGWKSSVQDILGETVSKMVSLGAVPQAIHAAIGASIGFDHFETDSDVPQAVSAYLGGETEGLFVRREDGKYLVDLRGANRRRLEQLGLLPHNIDVSSECTMCSTGKYWSHRATNGQRGSQGAMIILD